MVFALYVNSRPSTFHYERSELINADVELIYPYLNSLKLGSEWSPYEKIDPQMKKTYSGPDSGIGSAMDFSGNNEVGEGHLEIKKEMSNSLVELKLEMSRPIHAENIIEYRLTTENGATRFTWAMSGEANFMSKLVGIFVDCEKMVGDQFTLGIQNLKSIIESKKK